eukprot:scaffold131_cov335-Pavlova_lutheri.AAC.24
MEDMRKPTPSGLAIVYPETSESVMEDDCHITYITAISKEEDLGRCNWLETSRCPLHVREMSAALFDMHRFHGFRDNRLH